MSVRSSLSFATLSNADGDVGKMSSSTSRATQGLMDYCICDLYIKALVDKLPYLQTKPTEMSAEFFMMTSYLSGLNLNSTKVKTWHTLYSFLLELG